MRNLKIGAGFCAALTLVLLTAGCEKKGSDPAAEAPPPTSVQHEQGVNVVHVDRSERFPLVAAVAREAASTLNVTGSVNPDISREIPIVSIASGRVVAVHVRLGDYVKKGQLVMEVQSSDISGAFNNYLKAVNDEHLANTQLERAKILYDKGAIAKSQLEIAQDGEDDAKANLVATEEQLHVLGIDKDHPGETVKVYSPASGFIIQQNVTEAATAGVALSGSANAFTIADLSHVWIICDVYENDLSTVHLGQTADIRLNAYPDKAFTGTIGDIGAILDPNIRTGKVRIQVENPGNLMRIGMFATATFHGKKAETHTAVPASAVLHLHDRDWVYVPNGDGSFKRLAVQGGAMLPGNLQEISTGLAPGQQVVSNALELQNSSEQ
ncbi:cobalt-zinc-cadmium efflux system membrane fusion protein [Silvibacterium bohemicum]|uniref:Cobalt-zinc-cadmium efflux system membrane fusion protein n=1 Tax=Silvibacterium bohemicum TaxID=1577686 RepID=A0A841K3X7_9BACT|nr:efflux RND transporter periplasmic adaptor subunit [Silvibacterium bohemicum]MBB6147267.1 cobalt-zinc-cadmium efflux system membrane fusion protein [Silvibacterium bohemicum]